MLTALAVAAVAGVTIVAVVAMCAKKAQPRSDHVPDVTVDMMDNPLRKGGGAPASGEGVEMPRPRVRDDFDARPISERLGDLADDLNQNFGDDGLDERRLSLAKWSWPKTGLPMWRAPPPPAEPFVEPQSPTWSDKKGQTERKLFGPEGNDEGSSDDDLDVDAVIGKTVPGSMSGAVHAMKDDGYIHINEAADGNVNDPSVGADEGAEADAGVQSVTPPARRGSVYGFGDLEEPSEDAEPEKSPSSSSLDESGQWASMDFDAKRKRLMGSVNMGMMLPGAKPPPGLFKKKNPERTVEEQPENPLTDDDDEAIPEASQEEASNSEDEHEAGGIHISGRLNHLLARGPPATKREKPTVVASEAEDGYSKATAEETFDADGDVDRKITKRVKPVVVAEEVEDGYSKATAHEVSDEDEIPAGFGSFDDGSIGSPPLTPTGGLDEPNLGVAKTETLRRMRRPTGPAGKRLPNRSSMRLSRLGSPTPSSTSIAASADVNTDATSSAVEF